MLVRPSVRGSTFRPHRRETMSYAELGPRIRGLNEVDDDLMGFDMGGDAPILFDGKKCKKMLIVSKRVDDSMQKRLKRKKKP